MLQLVQQRTNTKWSPEEDTKLVELVKQHGDKSWTLIASKMVNRGGKQCRERWKNQLDPSLSRDPFSEKEDEQILALVKQMGTKWAEIARLMPGRSENGIKNRYYGNLQKSASKRRKDAAKRARARSDDDEPSDEDSQSDEDEDEAADSPSTPSPKPVDPPAPAHRSQARELRQPAPKKARSPSPPPKVAKTARHATKHESEIKHVPATHDVMPALPSFEATASFQTQSPWMLQAQQVQPRMYEQPQPQVQPRLYEQPPQVQSRLYEQPPQVQPRLYEQPRAMPQVHRQQSLMPMRSMYHHTLADPARFPNTAMSLLPYGGATSSYIPMYHPLQSSAAMFQPAGPGAATSHSSVLKAFAPSLSRVPHGHQETSAFDSPVAIKALLSTIP